MQTVEASDIGDELPLDELRAVLDARPVRLAILFGSHASGDARSRSDVDLAVELERLRPGDAGYNDVFFGLSADVSERLETNDVDVVDVHSASPSLARAIFEDGVLLVGTPERAAELRRRLARAEREERSPRKRFDDAVRRIDEHFA